MKTKAWRSFIVMLTLLVILGAETYSQDNVLVKSGETIYEKMEKSSQQYYFESAHSLGDSIKTDDYLRLYFPQVIPHAEYPKVITNADSTIELCFFEFDSLAMGKVSLGNAYFMVKKYAKARKLYEEAISISDSCYVAYLDVGNCYLSSGDPVKALKYYKKAYDINPFDYKISFYQGRAYMMMKKNNEALEKYVEALTLMPRNEKVLNELSKLTKVMGLKLADNSFHPQALAIRKDDGVHIYLGDDPGKMAVWFPYAGVKALWLGENYYGDSLAIDKKGKYNWSVQEEREALFALIGNYLSLKKDNNVEQNEYLDRLAAIVKSDYIDGFILYEILSHLNSDVVLLMPQTVRDEVRSYINKYVIVR